MQEQYIQVGKITNIHGIMGEVRIHPWADSPEFLCKFDTFYLDSAHFPMEVERSRVHKTMCVVKFKEIIDVPSALSVRNADVYIDRKDANLPEGHFFLADIEGLPIIDNETGEELGKLAEVINTPAHNVYVVRGGAREFMVPAVPHFIKETNLEEGFIRVQMMEGL